MRRDATSHGQGRRWRAVSLRAAMVLIAAAAVGLGWWTERAQAHRRAVVELRRRGAAVTVDTVRGPGPAGLWGPRPIPPTERWLRRRLGDWPFERVGYVGLGEHGDAELELAGRLDEAQVMTVESDRITDAGLAHLRGFHRLEHLSLIAPGSKLGDAGLAHLADLIRLEELDLDGPGVTDAGLAHLRGLRRLKILAVVGSRVGDAGVEHLLGLDRLETLSLTDSALTDAGLARLAALPRLQSLGVCNTRVTAAGVAALRRARPDIQVHWSDPSQPVICAWPGTALAHVPRDRSSAASRSATDSKPASIGARAASRSQEATFLSAAMTVEWLRPPK